MFENKVFGMWICKRILFQNSTQFWKPFLHGDFLVNGWISQQAFFNFFGSFLTNLNWKKCKHDSYRIRVGQTLGRVTLPKWLLSDYKNSQNIVVGSHQVNMNNKRRQKCWDPALNLRAVFHVRIVELWPISFIQFILLNKWIFK